MSGEHEVSTIFEVLANVAIFCIMVSIMVSLMLKMREYDHTITDITSDKSSIEYTLAYSDSEYYMTPGNVLNDIKASGNVAIYINNSRLYDSTVNAAKGHNETVCREILLMLGNGQYKKITGYDSLGHVTQVKYERR